MKLTRKTKLLFSAGDLSTTLTLAIQTYFQLYFLTDVARIDPSSAAWIIGITRLWDAFNDPIVGLISDRIKSKFGRRRVLLVYGSVPLGLAFALCWFIPPLSQFGLAVYFTLIIIAFDTAFTIIHVGYNALTPVMTYDYDERSSLNGYRMMFSLGGTLAAVAFATFVGEVVNDEATRFSVVGTTLGVLAIIPPWIVFHVTRDVDVDSPSSGLSYAEAIKSTFANRAFLFLAMLFMTSWTATCVIAATLVFFANYYLRAPEHSYYLVLAAQSSAVVCVPLVVWFAKKWDKPKAFLVGIGFWCLVLIGIFALPKTSVSLGYVAALLCGPGIATAAVIPWSMLPDVIEVDQERTGMRREGSYYALISFLQKLGTGFALWGIGQSLAYVGYVTPTPAELVPAQPEEVVNTIRFIMGPVTILLLVLSLPFAIWYPITRQSHTETLVRIGK